MQKDGDSRGRIVKDILTLEEREKRVNQITRAISPSDDRKRRKESVSSCSICSDLSHFHSIITDNGLRGYNICTAIVNK